jgi:hypothetical protein
MLEDRDTLIARITESGRKADEHRAQIKET